MLQLWINGVIGAMCVGMTAAINLAMSSTSAGETEQVPDVSPAEEQEAWALCKAVTEADGRLNLNTLPSMGVQWAATKHFQKKGLSFGQTNGQCYMLVNR